MPNPDELPIPKPQFRRELLRGRGVSVFREQLLPTQWPEHSHPEVQVILLLDPATCTFRWKQATGEWTTETVRDPSVWVLGSDIPHSVDLLENCDVVVIYITRELVEKILPNGLPHSVCVPLGKLCARDLLLIQLSIALRELCKPDDVSSSFYIEGICAVFAQHTLHALYTSTKPERRRGLSPERLHLVTRHIETHLAHHLDSATLARMVGLCRSQFIRLFKRSLGLTPRDFVMNRRTVKAHDMFLDTDEKVTVVADLCGFSDDTHLTRWLRRTFNVVPSEIRTPEYRLQRGRQPLP